jgi:hypothetical protein
MRLQEHGVFARFMRGWPPDVMFPNPRNVQKGTVSRFSLCANEKVDEPGAGIYR